MSYSISGNTGVAGATVTYTGTASGSVTADGSGNYSITGLSNGSYTITPSLAGYTFTAVSLPETVSGASITGVNFTALSTSGAINFWKPQAQNIVPPVSSDEPGNPNVVYESGAQILSGTVFKMWFGTTAGVCYAESVDGLTWTRYGSNPVIATPSTGGGSNRQYCRVQKIGSTYYAFVSQMNLSKISVWTSTDGITFSEQNATGLAAQTQTWEGGIIAYISVVGKDGGGTWHGYYGTSLSASYVSPPLPTPYGYGIGHCTSTDLINWTKDPANPPLAMNTNYPSNFFFQKVGNAYYGWSEGVANPFQVAGSTNLANANPSDILRFCSANLGSGWAQQFTSPAMYRTQNPNEGPGVGSTHIGDVSIVSDGSTLWCFYGTNKATGATDSEINVYVAPGKTITDCVQTYEGVQNYPLTTNAGLALNLVTTQTDSFLRADANPLNGSWANIPITGYANAQLVSHTVESATASTGMAVANTNTFGNNQWSQVVLSACANTSYVGLMLRASTGADTWYRAYWNGTSGGGASSIIFDRTVAGVYGSIGNSGTNSGQGVILNNGDVLTFCVIGNVLSFYQNGNLLITAIDGNIASGHPGIFMQPNGAVGNAAVTTWAGGSFANSVGGNVGVVGATVSDGTNTTTSDAGGNYVLAPETGSVTIAPSLAGYTFSPTSASETVSSANITGVNFTAVPLPASAGSSFGFGFKLDF